MQMQEQLAEAIGGAMTLARLDSLARWVWQGWSAGAVPEDAAQSLAEAVHSRKIEVRGTIPVGIPAGRRHNQTSRTCPQNEPAAREGRS